MDLLVSLVGRTSQGEFRASEKPFLKSNVNSTWEMVPGWILTQGTEKKSIYENLHFPPSPHAYEGEAHMHM